MGCWGHDIIGVWRGVCTSRGPSGLLPWLFLPKRWGAITASEGLKASPIADVRPDVKRARTHIEGEDQQVVTGLIQIGDSGGLGQAAEMGTMEILQLCFRSRVSGKKCWLLSGAVPVSGKRSFVDSPQVVDYTTTSPEGNTWYLAHHSHCPGDVLAG